MSVCKCKVKVKGAEVPVDVGKGVGNMRGCAERSPLIHMSVDKFEMSAKWKSVEWI